MNFGAVLRGIPAARHHGPYQRGARVKYVTPPQDPLTGRWSKIVGGRFTPMGSFETIYLADNPVTALAETLQDDLSRMRLRFPLVAILTIEGILPRVLDLTDEKNRSALGIKLQDLLGPWDLDPDPMTHILGRSANSCGLFDAILYPSAVLTGQYGRCSAWPLDECPRSTAPSMPLPPSAPLSPASPHAGACIAVLTEAWTAPAYLQIYDPDGQVIAKRLEAP